MCVFPVSSDQNNDFFFSYTIEIWVSLPVGYDTSQKQPLLCTVDSSFCMYLEDGTLHGKMGQHVVNGTTVIPEEDWTLMVMRYDAEGEIVAE